MTGHDIESSPQVYARIAGVFYLLESLTAVFGQFFVLGRLVVHGDTAATAANILGHEPLFRLGFASSLMAVAFHIAWALLFYELLKPVNRQVSLLATFVILVGCAIQALASLLYLAPLLVLADGSSLSAFTAGQLQALALVFLELNGQAFNTYLVFFGFWCVLVGYLIFKSTFLPRIIGLLLVFAGLGYLTLLSAPLANILYPFNVATAGPGEISLLLWLLVKGVNVRKWKEKAGVWTGGQV
jgi:hypothetical protein